MSEIERFNSLHEVPSGVTMQIVGAKELPSIRKQLTNDMLEFWQRQDQDTIRARFQVSCFNPNVVDLILNHLVYGVYLYDKNQEIIAIAEACTDGHSPLEIGVAVEKDYRKKGLAKNSLYFLLDKCVEQGYHTFQVSTGQANAPVKGMVRILEAIGIPVTSRFDPIEHTYVYRWEME